MQGTATSPSIKTSLAMDISISLSVIFGTWLIIYSSPVYDPDLILLSIGVVCFIVALTLLVNLYFRGHLAELKRAASFSVLSAGMVFALLSLAYLFENMTYPELLLENPIALFSFLMTIVLIPTALYLLGAFKKGHELLLDHLACSTTLTLGAAGVVLSPYPIYMKMQDPMWDPDGIGCCIALGYLSFVLIPLGIIWRWRTLKKIER